MQLYKVYASWLMKLMSKIEYLIVPKGTKFMGSGKLGLTTTVFLNDTIEVFIVSRCTCKYV